MEQGAGGGEQGARGRFMVLENSLMDKYQRNLGKSLELIDVCFNLKEAYLKQKHPATSQQEISAMIYQGILSRKKRQWKSPGASSKP